MRFQIFDSVLPNRGWCYLGYLEYDMDLSTWISSALDSEGDPQSRLLDKTWNHSMKELTIGPDCNGLDGTLE